MIGELRREALEDGRTEFYDMNMTLHFTVENNSIFFPDNTSVVCPTIDRESHQLRHTIDFWVAGVFQPGLAFFGILGNLISAFILSR